MTNRIHVKKTKTHVVERTRALQSYTAKLPWKKKNNPYWLVSCCQTVFSSNTTLKVHKQARRMLAKSSLEVVLRNAKCVRLEADTAKKNWLGLVPKFPISNHWRRESTIPVNRQTRQTMYHFLIALQTFPSILSRRWREPPHQCRHGARTHLCELARL